VCLFLNLVFILRRFFSPFLHCLPVLVILLLFLGSRYGPIGTVTESRLGERGSDSSRGSSECYEIQNFAAILWHINTMINVFWRWIIKKKTPWLWSASEPCRPTERPPLLGEVVPTFADRGIEGVAWSAQRIPPVVLSKKIIFVTNIIFAIFGDTPSLQSSCYRWPSPLIKRPGREEADHPPPSSDEANV
jgi:hypothetical protein